MTREQMEARVNEVVAKEERLWGYVGPCFVDEEESFIVLDGEFTQRQLQLLADAMKEDTK